MIVTKQYVTSNKTQGTLCGYDKIVCSLTTIINYVKCSFYHVYFQIYKHLTSLRSLNKSDLGYTSTGLKSGYLIMFMETHIQHKGPTTYLTYLKL